VIGDAVNNSADATRLHAVAKSWTGALPRRADGARSHRPRDTRGPRLPANRCWRQINRTFSLVWHYAPHIERRAGAMSLYQIVRKITGLKTTVLTEESNAQNTPGWDSLHQIELIFAIEGAYRVRFTVAEMTRLKNIGDIRRLLLAKGADVENVDEGSEERLTA
jgi:acyl carrier protein